MLILRGVIIIIKLNAYRGNAIAKLRTQTLNSTESMALNHVYLFNDESIYTSAVVDPLLDHHIEMKGLKKAGHFTEMKGDSRTKPDITYSATIHAKVFDVFIVEVKCPSSKQSDDFLKLSTELYMVLDRVVQAGVDAPQVFRMMVYGYSCSTSKMDLVAPATYRKIKPQALHLSLLPNAQNSPRKSKLVELSGFAFTIA